jgi:hypothetical protein
MIKSPDLGNGYSCTKDICVFSQFRDPFGGHCEVTEETGKGLRNRGEDKRDLYRYGSGLRTDNTVFPCVYDSAGYVVLSLVFASTPFLLLITLGDTLACPIILMTVHFNSISSTILCNVSDKAS